MEHSPLTNRIVAHFKALERQSLEVPEFPDEEGNPTTLYWSPLTMAERNEIAERTGGKGLLAMVRLVIMKAQLTDGKPAFLEQDRLQLTNACESGPVERLALAIMGDSGN